MVGHPQTSSGRHLCFLNRANDLLTACEECSGYQGRTRNVFLLGRQCRHVFTLRIQRLSDEHQNDEIRVRNLEKINVLIPV